MTEVELVVAGRPGLDLAELDSLTRELGSALVQEARVRVTAPAAPDEPGTKTGPAIEIGRLIIGGVFSASTAAAVASVLRIWLVQRRAGTITLGRGPDKIVITGATEADVHEALDRLPEMFGPTEPES